MKKGEVLERVYFLDLLRSRLSKHYEINNNVSKIPSREISKIFKISEEMAKNLSLKDLREIIKKNPADYTIWLPKYKNKQFKLLKINPNDLCIDESHHNCLNGLKEPRGTKLINYYKRNKNNPEIKKRINFVEKYWDLFHPSRIIIKKVSGNLEVMNGNHRAIVACLKKLKKIEVLCIL